MNEKEIAELKERLDDLMNCFVGRITMAAAIGTLEIKKLELIEDGRGGDND